jgi:RNA polymerase sigma factor (sigma-70 family)
MTTETLEVLAARAAGGDGDALETFVGRIQDDVYRLALRMLADPADAEDATQEILVKVVTHLSDFRGESGVRTWVWRIATNHVLSFRRSRREAGLSFEQLEGMLAAGIAAEPALGEAPADALLEEEVKLGCTHTMLTCLDRDHRAAFVLGAVFELPGEECAEILDIDHAAYRKRLSRARRRMREFMERSCGLVNADAACRCRRQIRPTAHAGLLDPERPVYALHPVRAQSEPGLRQAYSAIEAGERYLEVVRSHPEYAAPDSVRETLRRALARA